MSIKHLDPSPLPEVWLNLQTDYDLRMIRRKRGRDIQAQVRARAA